MAKKTPEQLLAEAHAALSEGCQNIAASLRRFHPQTGCLPTPELHVPATAGQMSVYGDELYGNLWDDHAHKSKAWWDCREQCPHLDPAAVHRAYEIVSCWRSLVLAAHRHVQGQGRSDPYGIEVSAEILQVRLDEFESAATSALTDSARCRRCGQHAGSGEGWDGMCGDCADRDQCAEADHG